jgi:[acyl-carrier-protein] S-malonyltransferase
MDEGQIRVGTAVIFPGQGTQHAQMGAGWRAPPHWTVVERAEAALGRPLGDLLLEAPAEVLARTLEAQLSVLLCSLMAWDMVAGELALGDGQGPVVAFAGHSLGQLTALVAAGALSLEDGVVLAAQRARATQDAVDRHPGRMAALIGAELDQAEDACTAHPQAWVANDNAPGQVVIGGSPGGLEAACQRARDLGVRRVVPLNVGGAFHTPLFAEAAEALRPALAAAPFRAGSAPVVSNVDARAHTDPSVWPAQLADHLVSPVRWRECLLTLSRLGATSLVEVGPGNVLAGLARRTLTGVPVRNVAVPADVETVRTPLEVC